jgi:tripartite-type tricarboxylate transporter receptor subunit TctC
MPIAGIAPKPQGCAMTLGRRHFLKLWVGLGAVPFAMRNAEAQAYPTRPVRIIGTTGPGGQGDTTARLVAAKLTETLGQPFYVENMPGGGGNIAMGATARAAPDGYTVLCATSNIVTNISLYPKIPYDPYKDFEPVSLLCSSPHVLVVHPSVQARSVAELVALAKADPGKLSYASAGRGTPAHLAGELFKVTFGVDITHVPFNGGGPGTAAAIAGHVQMSVSALPTAVTYVRAGNLRDVAMFVIL